MRLLLFSVSEEFDDNDDDDDEIEYVNSAMCTVNYEADAPQSGLFFNPTGLICLADYY